MKKLRYFCLAFLAASLVAIPAAAQNSEKGERNNNGTGELGKKQHGEARADEVQADNHQPSKGSNSEGKKTRRHGVHSHHGARK